MTVPWNIGHYERLELRLHWGNKENDNYMVLNGKKVIENMYTISTKKIHMHVGKYKRKYTK